MLRAARMLLPAWRSQRAALRRKHYPPRFMYSLRNIPAPLITRLINGVTIVTEYREDCHACVGLYMDGGSRYESLFENGIAHFFEHIAFKGTLNRTRADLEYLMSSTGARFRNFTTRELVGYYAQCLCEDVTLVVDILADCIYCNALSCPEIEYQKRVVYLEMQEEEQNHETTLFDYLHGAAFHGTSLAQTVIGPSTNLYNFNSCTLAQYIARCFDPTRMVLAVVGPVDHEHIVQLAERYLLKLEPCKCLDLEYRFTGADFRYRDDSMTQAYAAVAFEGPPFYDDDHYALDVAMMYMGGWDRTMMRGEDSAHKLARAFSCTHICDAYKTFNIKYKDTSLFGIQFMGTKEELDSVMYVVQDEWMKLCNVVTLLEVDRAKNELKTRMLRSTESATDVCHDLARWVLYCGCRPSLHERISRIDRVSHEEVQQTCSKYMYDRCPAVAAVGPIEGMPDYTRIRAGQYWLRL